jgi:hypothetical protein
MDITSARRNSTKKVINKEEMTTIPRLKRGHTKQKQLIAF